MILLVHIVAAASFIGILYVVWEYVQGYRCASWPSTKGVIVQSELGSVPGNRREKVSYIYYRYVVNGKTHYSRRIAMYVANLLPNDEAQKLRRAYPVNKDVVVKYHPMFNGFSVLETGQRQTFVRTFLLLVFLSVFLVSTTAVLKPGFNPVFEAVKWAVG